MSVRQIRLLNIFVLSLGYSFLLGGFLPNLLAAVRTTAVLPTVDLKNITVDLLDSNVDVQATIKSIIPPREGSRAPYKLSLDDATAALDLVIWPDNFETLKKQSAVAVGDLIRATVRVSKYRDYLQLQLAQPDSLQIITKAKIPESATVVQSSAAAPSAPESGALTPLAAVKPALLGKEITVKAVVSEIHEPRSETAPYIVALTQDNSQVSLVFWKDLYDQIKDKIRVGNVVQVRGLVAEHRGTMEIKLTAADGLSVVAPTGMQKP